jgi:hypothetical protein
MSGPDGVVVLPHFSSGFLIVPYKANAKCRHHIPKQKRKLTNWPAYEAGLRQRGDVTVWFTDAAIAGWRAEPRTSRGGQSWYSPLAILTALTTQSHISARAAPDRRFDRFHPSPAWPCTPSARSYHLVPPGRWPGRAAPAIRGRRHESDCRQHRSEVSRLWRMADGEARHSDTPLLAEAAHRP